MLIENYNELIENYSENYAKYTSMSTRSNMMYNMVYTLINKEIGKHQVSWDIEKARENVLKTQLDIEISYRNQFYNMYSLEKNMNTAYINYLNQLDSYENSVDLFNNGYINDIEMEYANYTKLYSNILYHLSKRNFENSLSQFNLEISNEYTYNEYDFSITEIANELLTEEEYVEYAIENSPVIIEYDRQIEKHHIKLDYLDRYNLINISYAAKLDFLKTDLLLEIALLERQEYIDNLEKSINSQYLNLLLKNNELSNYKLAITISEIEKDENKQYYLKGYIDSDEYTAYVEKYDNALIEYSEKIYAYNSLILNLEKLACIYMKGVF